MCSGGSTTVLAVVGFPIRTPTDQCSVGNSPWLIATSNVLLRLQAPRHPPLALCSLEQQRCSCSLWSSQGTEEHEAPKLRERSTGADIASNPLTGGQCPRKTEQRRTDACAQGHSRGHAEPNESTPTYESSQETRTSNS
jgi:hypothetical protein